MNERLFGCGTALITPFTDGGEVDERALRELVDWQIGEGIHYLVPCGSTGEALTLAPEEQRRVVEIVVEQAAARVPIVAGASNSDTRRAVATSRMMREAGATHLLHASPAYSKPPQRGIVAHYRAIVEEAGLPIIVYNVPGRTASNIEPETTLELAAMPGIAGIKEASGNMEQIRAILRGRPDSFAVISGDDPLTVDVMRAGGDGIISVVSNALPGSMARVCELCRDGRHDEAVQLQARMASFTKAAFLESNPIPIKAAVAMMGRVRNVLRLPLVPLDARHEAEVRGGLVAAGALA